MSSTSTSPGSCRAVIGIDWADASHAVCLRDAATGAVEHSTLSSASADISRWLDQLTERYGGGTGCQLAGGAHLASAVAGRWGQRTGGGKQTRPGPQIQRRLGAEELRAQLIQGAMAHGYSNELQTLRRIARLILDRFGLRASPSGVWRLLRRMKWSPQKPQRKARERDEEKISQWKTERRPELQAMADKEQRTIVFVDECGFSQKTAAKKTWAPSGQTPVLGMNFNRDKLSVTGGISLKSIWFQIHEESIKSTRVTAFLDQLKRYAQGSLLVIRDGLPAHRSKVVAQYLSEQKGRIRVERLLPMLRNSTPSNTCGGM